MTPRQLPRRPSLDQLKRQAKDLLRSARAQDSVALARFRILPAFARHREADLARAGLALHEAQSVIAREHGFPSWKELHAGVEELALELDAAVDEFIEAATDERSDRARRLLALHPTIASASFHTALLLGDATAVEAWLADDPKLATRPGGPREWEPLQYLCHTSLHRGPEARPDGLVSIARGLLALGADPDTRFPWKHHGVRRAALWGATRVTRQLPLAEALLEAGAVPDDGVTLPLAAGAGDLPVLELLRAHGADVNHPWATDGASPLYSILGWAETSEGVRWLLEHGADPDPVFADNGETPLHVVARRWDVELAELLVARGAEPTRPRADGRTPYAVAELSGNGAVADWLLEHGASGDLSEVDRLVAACSRGERATAEAMLRTRPGLRAEIGDEHHAALHRAAERGDPGALEAMLACGFDPDHADDEMGATALHRAAMAGRADAVRVLLDHGASVALRDHEFNAQPLVWAAEGSGSTRREDADHAGVARLLLDEGSPVDWETGQEPAARIVEVLTEWRRAHAEGRL